jgi:hypothetical protein
LGYSRRSMILLKSPSSMSRAHQPLIRPPLAEKA